jgi:hypothetical protein
VQQRLPSATRTVARAASVIVSFLAAAGLSWTAVDRALSVGVEPPPIIGQDLADALRVWRRGFSHGKRAQRVALLGDSVLGAAPGERTVPDATDEALSASGARGRAVALHPLSWPGWGIAAQYFLADEIVRARPDRIMLELNLRALGPASPGDVSYPELSGFIGGDRLWEAAGLPLSYAGITLDRLLFFRLLVTSELDGSWAGLRRRQANVFRLREPLETWLDAIAGTPESHERRLAEAISMFDRMLVPGQNRERESMVKTTLGNALGGIPATHARLRVLEATLDHFHRSGIPTVVWVAPVNIDHLRSLGLSLDGLERSLATVQEVVESSGAGFVDFHALLPDREFRDGGDHVTPGRGATVLGQNLARVILWSVPVDTPPLRDALVDESASAVQ